MSTQVGSIHYDLSINSKDFDEKINSISSKLKKTGDSMVSFGKTMTVGVTLPLAAFTIGMVASAAALEKTAASFNVLVGEGTKARKLFADIKKFADTTPFEFPELAKATTTMLGYGVMAEDVLDRLKRLGDAAAASGGDLNGITLAYAQMIGRGKVTGDNLRQLTENMVTLRSELSQVSGVPMNQLDKAIEGGVITIGMLNQALDLATNQGGKFFGGTEKLAQTFSGRMSTVKDQLQEVGRNLIGVKVDPELGLTVQEGGIFDMLSKLLPMIAENAKKLGDAFAALTPQQQRMSIGATVALAALGPMLLIFGNLVKAVSFLIPLFINPAFLIAAAVIGAIALVAYLLYQNWDTVVNFYNSSIVPMMQGFVTLLQPVIDVVSYIISLFGIYLLPVFETLFNFMMTQFKQAWESIMAAVKDFQLAIEPLMPVLSFLATGVLTVLVIVIGAVIAAISLIVIGFGYLIAIVARVIGWIAQFIGAFLRLRQEAIDKTISAIQGIITTISNFIGNIRDAGANLIGGFVDGIKNGFKGAVNAVADGLGKIRKLLPFSPAKEGPFSGKGWTLYSGRSLMQGLADGIKQNANLPQLAIDNALGGAQLSLAGGTQSQSSPVSNTSISINGDITLGDRSAVTEFFNRLNRNNELAQKGMAVI